MEDSGSPNYRASPQDIVTAAFIKLVEALAIYERDSINYGGQITPETGKELLISYNTMRRLVSSDLMGKNLTDNVKGNITVVGRYLDLIRDNGYFNTKMNIAE